MDVLARVETEGNAGEWKEEEENDERNEPCEGARDERLLCRHFQLTLWAECQEWLSGGGDGGRQRLVDDDRRPIGSRVKGGRVHWKRRSRRR